MEYHFNLLPLHLHPIQLVSGSCSLLLSLKLNVGEAPTGTIGVCLQLAGLDVSELGAQLVEF